MTPEQLAEIKERLARPFPKRVLVARYQGTCADMKILIAEVERLQAMVDRIADIYDEYSRNGGLDPQYMMVRDLETVLKPPHKTPAPV